MCFWTYYKGRINRAQACSSLLQGVLPGHESSKGIARIAPLRAGICSSVRHTGYESVTGVAWVACAVVLRRFGNAKGSHGSPFATQDCFSSCTSGHEHATEGSLVSASRSVPASTQGALLGAPRRYAYDTPSLYKDIYHTSHDITLQLTPAMAAAHAPAAFDLGAWEAQLDLGPQKDDSRLEVYLVTLARVLASTLAAAPHLRDVTTLSREEVRAAVWDALENPAASASGAGRPRSTDAGPLVLKMLVVMEKHADGSIHFHVAVKLSSQQRFLAAKRTLLSRHGLASHWSSTHTQWWSALRYCMYTSDKKPVVDADRLCWSAPGSEFDPFEDAQERFIAKAWNQRREKKAAEAPATKQKETFGKLDFNALVELKNLKTKKRVLEYVQDHGTAAMQDFCAKHQRRIQEYLEDAREWSQARAAAQFEKKSDWQVLLEAADTACPQGTACLYAEAARSFFAAHQASFSAVRLAASLRAIIMKGPSKDVRVPFLVGATNTGKSTIVESFDALFGEENVFHLPAETDNKGGALREWLQDKRFVFWDEFEPLLFISKGVMPKSQFLKAFNGQVFTIQMNQRTNDGNKTFKWTRGAVFTAKSKELWSLRDGITLEDVSHIQSRVELFHCSGQIKKRPGGIPQCRHCLATWIRDFAAQHDANGIVAAPIAQEPSAQIAGLEALLETARVSKELQAELVAEIADLGTIHVRELAREDWQSLNVWSRLREMERRRILNACDL